MNDRFKTIIESFSDSERDIRVLPADYDMLRRINETYDIYPDNTFGILLNNSGGIVIDNWIRLYGAGKLNFLERNKLCPFSNIVVGEDICGGLFIILDSGTLGYFAPDSLEIEDMEITFAQFLHWCIHGDIDLYYKDFRWMPFQRKSL